MSDIVCIKREVGDRDAAMWQQIAARRLVQIINLQDELAAREAVSQPTEPPTVAEPVFDKVIVNEAGKWFAMPPKNSVTVDDHIAIAKIWLQEAANDEDQFPDDIALAHAAIAQAESLATIATLLASVISDTDASYAYIRTHGHG